MSDQLEGSRAALATVEVTAMPTSPLVHLSTCGGPSHTHNICLSTVHMSVRNTGTLCCTGKVRSRVFFLSC